MYIKDVERVRTLLKVSIWYENPITKTCKYTAVHKWLRSYGEPLGMKLFTFIDEIDGHWFLCWGLKIV